MKKLLEKVRYISVRTYMILLGCVILPIFALFWFVQNEYEVYIQDQLSMQIIQSISRSEDAVHNSFKNMAGISSAIVTDPELLKALQDPEATAYRINKSFDECVNYSSVNNLFTSDAFLITLFDSRQRSYANWSLNFQDYSFLLHQTWVQQAYHAKGSLIWNLFFPAFIYGSTGNVISVARAIMDPSYLNAYGILIVSMPQEYLSKVLQEYCFRPNDCVYILGDGDTPILSYAPEDSVTSQELSETARLIKGSESGNVRVQTQSGTRLVSYYTLNAPWTMGETALRIVHFTDFQSVVSRMNEFSTRMVGYLILALVFSLGIMALIVRKLVQPIQRLSFVMRNYRMGESLPALNMQRRDEIGHLNRSFQRLTLHLQELFSSLEHEYRIKEQYRYETLRSQLNPHFLFNTLTTIRYMSIMQHADSITESIDALAAVLKYSFGQEGERSRLIDEINHVKGYIAIQNMRFGQLIELEEDFEPEILLMSTLRFILQPIVENVVIHAFKDRETTLQRCIIRLYGHVEDGRLYLYVEDNGNGIQPETVDMLNSGTHKKMTGIGFSHVKEMIEITFGEGYSLSIQSTPDVGTVVQYILPLLDQTDQGGLHEKNIDR